METSNSNANIIFIFERSNKNIQCTINDKMLDICNNISTKISQDINSLEFLCGEKEINMDSKLADYQDLIDNKTNILVYKKESLICHKCKQERQLNNQKLDIIIESINKINFQMNNINMMLNIINQNVKNNEQKINDLINENNNKNNITNENNINNDKNNIKNENNNLIENIKYKSRSYIIYEKNGIGKEYNGKDDIL